MRHRALILAAWSCATAFAYHMHGKQLASTTITRLHFGSCNKHDRPQPVWPILASRTQNATAPPPFVWLGDIVYADAPFILKLRIPADNAKLKRYFDLQKHRPDYEAFAARTGIVGMLDDHDAGINDASSHNIRENATRYLLDFLDEPAGSPRRQRVEANEAAFASYLFGQKPRRVHLIMLDNRSKRDPYDDESHQDMLGETQWQWLHDQLANTEAEITIIGAGLEIVSRGDPDIAESWSKLAQSQSRLFALIASLNKGGVFFITGDVHFTEINRLWMQYQMNSASTMAYPLYDFTSSGLTHSWGGLIKSTVVRTALMHTHRVREDGLTLGEERECLADGSVDKPAYCEAAFASKRGLESKDGGFHAQPGSWSLGVGLGLGRPHGASNKADSFVDSAKGLLSSGLRDLFSSEQNVGEIDIHWETRKVQKQAAGGGGPAIEEEEVVSLDSTVVTFRTIGLVGEYANTTLYEYSFPLSHIYPQPVRKTAATETAAAPDVHHEGGLLSWFRELFTQIFLSGVHAQGDASPLLVNGRPVPADATSGKSSAAKYDDVASCAKGRIDAGFTEVCARFMRFVGPHLTVDDSIRYLAGHFIIFALLGLAALFFVLTPFAIWRFRRQLNAVFKLRRSQSTAAPRTAARMDTRASRRNQSAATTADDDAAPVAWYAIYGAGLAGAAAYLYSLG